MPVATICIPTYNGAEFLECCLSSALSQTLRDIEVVATDDASQDESIDILIRMTASDRRMMVFRNSENLGLVGNWNRCLTHATGRWIKFLFQDDVMEPNCLERMVEAGERTGRPLVACRRDFIFEAVPPAIIEEYEKYTTFISMDATAGDRGDLSPEDVCRAVLRFGSANFVGEPSSTLIRKDVFENLGTFHPGIIQLCDIEFWLRVGANFGIAYVPETLAHFRVHGQSTTSKNSAAKEFLKDVVDPLILAREFALAPAYKPLREVAKSSGIDLKRQFYTKLTDELCKAQIRVENNTADAEEWQRRLTALTAVHSTAALPHWVRAEFRLKLAKARARRTFDRHIAWRLPSCP